MLLRSIHSLWITASDKGNDDSLGFLGSLRSVEAIDQMSSCSATWINQFKIHYHYLIHQYKNIVWLHGMSGELKQKNVAASKSSSQLQSWFKTQIQLTKDINSGQLFVNVCILLHAKHEDRRSRTFSTRTWNDYVPSGGARQRRAPKN